MLTHSSCLLVGLAWQASFLKHLALFFVVMMALFATFLAPAGTVHRYGMGCIACRTQRDMGARGPVVLTNVLCACVRACVCVLGVGVAQTTSGQAG